jgi:hypothetical protein
VRFHVVAKVREKALFTGMLRRRGEELEARD